LVGRTGPEAEMGCGAAGGKAAGRQRTGGSAGLWEVGYAGNRDMVEGRFSNF
jgi:hypothetical protein